MKKVMTFQNGHLKAMAYNKDPQKVMTYQRVITRSMPYQKDPKHVAYQKAQQVLAHAIVKGA